MVASSCDNKWWRGSGVTADMTIFNILVIYECWLMYYNFALLVPLRLPSLTSLAFSWLIFNLILILSCNQVNKRLSEKYCKF